MTDYLGPFEISYYKATPKERATAALDQEIRKYMQAHNVDYLTAFEALQANKNQAVTNYAAAIKTKKE